LALQYGQKAVTKGWRGIEIDTTIQVHDVALIPMSHGDLETVCLSFRTVSKESFPQIVPKRIRRQGGLMRFLLGQATFQPKALQPFIHLIL